MSSTLQELLKELQKEYLATIPAKIVLIGELWKRQALVELETEFHKLKGTGRTYGLAEVSQIGEAVERLCENAPQTLPTAVPLALQVLAKIQESREQGQVFPIESDGDFLKVVELVLATGAKA